MQIVSISIILQVIKCCGTLGSAVIEAYFAFYSTGARHSGLTFRIL